jgi:hypothetical protein
MKVAEKRMCDLGTKMKIFGTEKIEGNAAKSVYEDFCLQLYFLQYFYETTGPA